MAGQLEHAMAVEMGGMLLLLQSRPLYGCNSTPGAFRDTEQELVGQLDAVKRAGSIVAALHGPQHSGAAGSARVMAMRFLTEQLTLYPALTDANIEPWALRVTTFLDAYANGSRAVQHANGSTVHVPLPALGALPLLRRVLMAQLAKAWLQELGRRIPERLEPLLAALVRRFYDVHRESVLARGVMEYFHISKSGGTSWNAAAERNGCAFPHVLGKFVKGFGDECRWINQSAYIYIARNHGILWGRYGQVKRTARYNTCLERLAHIAAKGYSYIANEYTLHGGLSDMRAAHTCPEVVNVVTLREPIARMESAIRFFMMYAKPYLQRHHGEERGTSMFEMWYCNSSRAFWEWIAPPIADNYVVRSFLGESGFHTRVGEINRPHLAVARRALLANYDLALDLGAGDAAVDGVARVALGWPSVLQGAPRMLQASGLQLMQHMDFSICYMNLRELEDLKRRQEYDVQLYGFGRVVAFLDTLWVGMARALGVEPPLPQRGRRAAPADVRCGFLHRGSNGSLLAQALGLELLAPPPNASAFSPPPHPLGARFGT